MATVSPLPDPPPPSGDAVLRLADYLRSHLGAPDGLGVEELARRILTERPAVLAEAFTPEPLRTCVTRKYLPRNPPPDRSYLTFDDLADLPVPAGTRVAIYRVEASDG